MKSSLLMILSLAYAPVVCAKATPVTLYFDQNFPPYSYKSGDSLVGIYPSLVRSVVQEMTGFDVTLEAIPWNRGLMLMEHEKGFALAPIYYLPDERPFIEPYSEPLVKEKVSVYCHESVVSELKQPIIWPRSFHGLSVGVNTGFNLGAPDFWKAVEDGHIKVQTAKSPEANIMMLYERRNDCYLHVALSVEWTVKEMLVKGTIESADWLVLTKNVDEEFGYIGYRAGNANLPYKDEFVEMFNGEFLKQKQSGLLDEIIEPYFN
ncbi:transporter substrate-binding domain-containing protein [Vibrio sp. 10N.261.55.A7]|uniref:substrate-binding periplasmic protein n=1 Tax=Vibrio sp. 10N.261.55.A7 TaxID=1880851 RepID=UPI000C82B2FA|nr:transporter substrate-binding domain-containing protein [Vibrio sp. 10N.261.55.A7]PMJ91976.1 hypothetical protein BCU12_08425 [Vibrio sp. 10N.261.55.A7]